MVRAYKKLHWTEHSKAKMKQYRLSKYKLMQLISKPQRREEGIVSGTTAVMQTNKTYSRAKLPGQKTKAAGEVWLMYRDVKDLRKIISAWRYPGVSKPGEEIPIPHEIREELLHQEL